jgi:helicase-like protein
MDSNLYDILVTTDVLAEGVNLQQARNIINYDLPWNPMRLVQRHGRIDRIGSPHRDVYIRCVFPDKRLNALLDLEARIRRKLAQAAATIGIENEVIPGAATGEHVFADTREQIERLRREDASIFETGGEDPTAHSGEEYRQELRKGLETYGDRVQKLPGGAGSGFVGGKLKGHFFCAKVGRDTKKERVFLRFVPWTGGEIIKDSLACLRLITCNEQTPRSMTDELADGAYEAWQRAQGDIFQEWKFATDPMNVQPSVRRSMKLAAAQIREYPPPGLTQREIDILVETIEAPWGGRIERQIREAMEGAKSAETSRAIADKVKELGLEPFQPPEPWPPIVKEEITLVCWIAVDT